MVFCYKTITDKPRRSIASGRHSPIKLPSSHSQLMRTIDYDDVAVIESIPQREWKLLAALARKREEDRERQKLADHFHKMWQQEREERQMTEAETQAQYTSYIHRKRQEEKSLYEHLRLKRATEEQLKTGLLKESIQMKQRRWKDLAATHEDRKALETLNKAVDEEYKAIKAADRRHRQTVFEDMRRKADLLDSMHRENEALERKNARLKEAKQRLAITNELSTWESLLHLQEVKALDAARRASHAAHAAQISERSETFTRERDAKREKARRIADHTRQMRDDVRMGLLDGVDVCRAMTL